jgi:gliding motility-associated-like protein/uncharacterized repeat protein (TIGR01451 family)
MNKKNIQVLLGCLSLFIWVSVHQRAAAQIQSYATGVFFLQNGTIVTRDTHFETNPGTQASPQTNSISGNGNQFSQHLGVFNIGTGSLQLLGAEIKATNNPEVICMGRFFYKVYPKNSDSEAVSFEEVELTVKAHCQDGSGRFNDGYGPCEANNDHKYSNLRNNHNDVEHQPVQLDLTRYEEGDYVVEVYYSISDVADTCDPTYINNNGSNYKVEFSLQCGNIVNPLVPNPQNFCGDGQPIPIVEHLNALGNRGVIKWYATAESATPLSVEEVLVSQQYFARQEVGNCKSNAVATQVNVTHVALPDAPVYQDHFCEIENPVVADLKASTSGSGVIHWYASEDSDTRLEANEVIVSGAYFVSQTVSGCESARLAVQIKTECDVTVTKTQVNTEVNPVRLAGTVVEYRIELTNNSDDTYQGITYEDILPNGEEGQLYGPIESLNADMELEPGETWVFFQTIDYDLGYWVTQADIDACTALQTTIRFNVPGLGIVEDAETTPVLCEVDLAVDKKVAAAVITPEGEVPIGEDVKFTITVTNLKGATATNIIIEEIMPSGYEVDKIKVKVDGKYDGIEWRIASLSPGATATLEIPAKVVNAGDYLNTATLVSLDQKDINQDNNSASDGIIPSHCFTNPYNLITPNDDGFNDKFVIECIEQYENKLEVFNRWGNKVFEAENYKNDWKGTSTNRFTVNGGAHLPSGTYFYVLQVKGMKQMTNWLYISR